MKRQVDGRLTSLNFSNRVRGGFGPPFSKKGERLSGRFFMASKKEKDKRSFDKLVKKLEKSAEAARKERAEKTMWKNPGARDPGNLKKFYV